jgi:hypothetical protein
MPPRERVALSPGLEHWRNWLPSTYYCTHALAPLVYVTEQLPVKVNALSIARREVDEQTVRRGDPGSVILCRTASGAVFRIFGLLLPGHSCWYRVHGDRGAMETTRGPGYFGPGQLRVWHDEWDCPADTPIERTYVPEWPEHAGLAKKAGHGGGDFWTNFAFAEAIRTGAPPFLDVYRGVTMSSVGILAWKSALADGQPFDMPDFRDESSRRAVENDHWSPFPSHADRQADQPAPSILGMPQPSGKAIEEARRIWAERR